MLKLLKSCSIRRAAACGLVLLACALGACQRSTQLHIAYYPWVGYETLSLANDFHWLPDNVVLHRYPSAELAKQALLEGKVQAATITLDETLRLRRDLPKLSIVHVMNESSGADVIVARPTISDVSELAGARVAFEAGSVSELLLRSALSSAGLSLGDIEVVDLPMGEQAAAYAAGEIDVIAGYPPLSNEAAELGALRIFDSSQIPETIFDVLVVDKDHTAGIEDLLPGVLAAHFRALDYLRSNHDDAVYRYAQYQGSTADAIRDSLAGVRIPAAPAVENYLQKGGALVTAARLLQDLDLAPVSDQGLNDLVDPSFLAKDIP